MLTSSFGKALVSLSHLISRMPPIFVKRIRRDDRRVLALSALRLNGFASHRYMSIWFTNDEVEFR
jgi:hypothetical protein